MIRGLQVVFDARPAGPELLSALRDLGVRGVRADCQNAGATAAALVAREIRDAGLYDLAIVATPDDARLLPEGTLAECYNEPDITLNGRPPLSPADYRRLLLDIHAVTAARGVTLVGGSISNLNRRGLDYLRALDVPSWPADIGVTFHRYPTGNMLPWTPHAGFASRSQEMDALRSIIGSRPVGCSEFGYHTGNQLTSRWDRFWGRSRCFTDAQQAEFAAWEWQYLADQGCTFAAWYQITDGDSSTLSCRRRQPGDCFGIRRLSGAWKPVADTFMGGR